MIRRRTASTSSRSHLPIPRPRLKTELYSCLIFLTNCGVERPSTRIEPTLEMSAGQCALYLVSLEKQLDEKAAPAARFLDLIWTLRAA